MDAAFAAVVGLIVLALIFDFINGFHDAANSIATVVSTRVLSPGKAVIWAAFFNFIAAFGFGTAVAKTVGSGMVDLDIVTYTVIFGGLMGAITWNLITWYYGLPTSSSHALFGGYGGAAVTKAGFGALIAAGWTKTLIFIVVAPMIGLAVGLGLMTAIYWLFRHSRPAKVTGWFRHLQLLSAAGFSLMHGANDAQKTMGIITGVLFTGGYLATFDVPFWVVLLAHDHRRDCRRRRDATHVGGAVGRRAADRLGVGADDSRIGRHRRPLLLRRVADLRRLRQPHREHRAAAGAVARAHGATVQPNQMLHDRETEARASGITRARAIDAIEALEHAPQIGGRDARTAIRNRQHDLAALAA